MRPATDPARAPALLVPPVRFGRLLRDVRLGNHESIDVLVRRCGLAFDEEFFASVEAGAAELDETMVRWITQLYDVPAEKLVPQRSRLVIDLEEGSLAIGKAQSSFEAPSSEALLSNYLGLVYELRGLAPGAPIKIRDLDLDVLAKALDLRAREVQSRLHELVSGDREPINSARRRVHNRLVVPLAGILVGAVATGALLFERAGEAPDPSPVIPAPGAPASSIALPPGVQIADAVTLTRP